MRNDKLTLLQELVGDAHAFTQQAAGITPQIENQSLQIAKFDPEPPQLRASVVSLNP